MFEHYIGFILNLQTRIPLQQLTCSRTQNICCAGKKTASTGQTQTANKLKKSWVQFRQLNSPVSKAHRSAITTLSCGDVLIVLTRASGGMNFVWVSTLTARNSMRCDDTLLNLANKIRSAISTVWKLHVRLTYSYGNSSFTRRTH